MRILALVPIGLFLSACWTPGPGQMDPTRYPWDPRNQAAKQALAPHPRLRAIGMIPPWAEPMPAPAQPVPTDGSYCVISLESSVPNGIVIGGTGQTMACSVSPSPAEPPPTPRN
jgi:hypothetical protein